MSEVKVHQYTGQPELEGGFACKVYPDANVKLSESKDAHGVMTTSVKIDPEKTPSSGQVALTRAIEGADVPVIMVSQGTYGDVYRKAAPDAPRLAPGKYIRLMNAELLTGFLNPFFVVILTPVVVWFFAWRVKRG